MLECIAGIVITLLFDFLKIIFDPEKMHPQKPTFYYPVLSCSDVSIFRHILAAVHFNRNLDRSKKVSSDGNEQVGVSYPKFKNGEATVRNIRVSPNFGKKI